MTCTLRGTRTVLCSVLRGNVPHYPHSVQEWLGCYFVADDGYHTGADLLTGQALRHIVFQAQMNSSILPLFMVSFKPV